MRWQAAKRPTQQLGVRTGFSLLQEGDKTLRVHLQMTIHAFDALLCLLNYKGKLERMDKSRTATSQVGTPTESGEGAKTETGEKGSASSEVSV
jgi:hypothetical protein